MIDPLEETISFNPVDVHKKMLLHQLEKSSTIGGSDDTFNSENIDDTNDIDRGSAALIGETGICFDQNNGEAYRTTKKGEIFSLQTAAFDVLMTALDQVMASVTLWNYAPQNTNLHGDGWNEEDLSIFSYDQQNDQKNVHSGGRGLPAIVRPYAHRISGVPVSMTFRAEQRLFTFTYDSTENKKRNIQSKETIIFVPHYQYGSMVNAIKVEVTDGRWKLNYKTQSIHWEHDSNNNMHTIKIQPK